MTASERDSPFFGDDDGELLLIEENIDASLGKPSYRLIRDENSMCYRCDEKTRSTEVPILDVLHEIEKWRADKREAYNRAMENKKFIEDVALLGHWRREVGIAKMQ